jgi:2-dehydro-3-deoxy-D-gluconate 5-dehydrogenase
MIHSRNLLRKQLTAPFAPYADLHARVARMKTPRLFDLTGRVAVVTGGNGGIGRGIALGLAEAGAAVAVWGRTEEKNQRVLSELQAIGVRSMALMVDMTNRAGLEPAVNKVESDLGSVNILVNNAGIASLSGGVMNEKPEDWDRVIETQLNSVFLLSKLAAQSMIRQKSGKIINIASMYSFFGSGLVPSYSAAKGAIVQLTKSMAIEFAPHNIQVNAIAPGWIETDMTAPVRTTPMNDEILARTPAGRWGQPEEVAGAAVYLASRASDFVTGDTIRVDGGYAIR